MTQPGRKSFPLFFASTLLLAACGQEWAVIDNEGTEDPTSAQAITLTGRIRADSVLRKVHSDPSRPDYIVSEILVIEADLTIEPGVVISAEADAGIDIAPVGSMKAMGTQSNQIVFRGADESPGYWRGIRIRSNSTRNVLRHAVITGGGSRGFEGSSLKSNIILNNSGRLQLDSSLITKSGGTGLFFGALETDLIGNKGNRFTSNTTSPVTARMHLFRLLDADSDYSGNGVDHIEHDPSGALNEFTGSHRWQALNVPYQISGAILSISGNLTIDPGARILFAENTGLVIGTSGSLTAKGTPETGIEFRGQEDVPGYWRGLRILSNNPLNELTHTQISNGGSMGFDASNRKANIEVGSTGSIRITNSKLVNSGGAGIRNQGGELVESDLSFADNAEGDIL